ncbi:hypothetical protein [Brenneria roseae]|nr:hypothetical protein [Brenneria roseae]
MAGNPLTGRCGATSKFFLKIIFYSERGIISGALNGHNMAKKE